MQPYRRNLPHIQRDFTPHFITFNTKRRRTLPDWARDIVLRCCIHDHEKNYRLRVAIIMPDHVHLVLTPLINDAKQEIISLFTILQATKSASAHFINKRSGHHEIIWQEESFDRIIRSSESLDAKIAYILANPVRQQLVDDWRDYRWIWREPERNPYAPAEKQQYRPSSDSKAQQLVEPRAPLVEPRAPPPGGAAQQLRPFEFPNNKQDPAQPPSR